MIHKVYEPQIRARLGTAAHFCDIGVLKLRNVPIGTAFSLRILRVIRRGARAMYKQLTSIAVPAGRPASATNAGQTLLLYYSQA